VSVLTNFPVSPPPSPEPEPEPLFPEPEPEFDFLSGSDMVFNSSNARTALLTLSLRSLAFFAAFPVFFAASPEEPARSSIPSDALPISSVSPPSPAPLLASYLHPKIEPKAFVTISAKEITFCRTALSTLINGLNALIKPPPTTAPSALKFSLSMVIWLCQESAVRLKSPVILVVCASTY